LYEPLLNKQTKISWGTLRSQNNKVDNVYTFLYHYNSTYCDVGAYKINKLSKGSLHYHYVHKDIKYLMV
jgi:hypothetical protein